MRHSQREVVRAVDTLTQDHPVTSFRAVAVEMEVPFSTAQGRIERAVKAGYLQYEETKSNTLRLGPGIVVHNGEVYRLVPIGERL